MFISFYKGLLHSLQQWRMAVLMLITSLLLTVPLVLPIFWMIFDTTRATAVAERMMADQIDLLWLIDLVNGRISGYSIESTTVSLLLGLLVTGVIYSLLHTLLTGGMISVLVANDRHFRMWDFWAGAGLYFWRFFRLMIISRLLQGLCLVGLILWMRRLGQFDEVATAYTQFIRHKWATVVVVILLLTFLSMVFDYARIRTVSHNATGMIRETWRAFTFTIHRIFSTSTLYFLVGVIGLALFAALVWSRGQIGQTGMGRVLAAFVVGQIALGVRFWHRIWFHAAQIEFYHRTAEPEVSAELPLFICGLPQLEYYRRTSEPEALPEESPESELEKDPALVSTIDEDVAPEIIRW